MDAEIISTIIQCTNFAAIKHRNQKRLDPEQTPYINHPIGKLSFLFTFGCLTVTIEKSGNPVFSLNLTFKNVTLIFRIKLYILCCEI